MKYNKHNDIYKYIKSSKFIKYDINSAVVVFGFSDLRFPQIRTYYILLHCLINRGKHKGDALP
jgi:hypothetical protein